MDSILRQLDTLQELLYSVEEFLEDCKENEVIEFLSDHWKECILGGIGAYFAISYSTNYVMVRIIQNYQYFPAFFFITNITTNNPTLHTVTFFPQIFHQIDLHQKSTDKHF